MLNLRPYQERCIDSLRKGFHAGHQSQILYMPTGAGKTETSIALMQATQLAGNRCAMVLDRRVLCNQTSQRLDKYNIDHGVLMSGHFRFRPHEPIQICSAQTLEARGSFPGLKLLIVDEAHAIRKETAEFIKSTGIRSIGLTASPFTKGLGNIYTNVVNGITTHDLVSEGSLVPLKIFIAKEIDMTGAKKVAGEWSPKEATERGIKITGDVVSEWIAKTHEIFGGPKKTIVFCSGVAHGADLATRFAESGYNFVSLSYRDDDQFKQDVIDEFSKPDSGIHGLIATDILTKGFDCLSSDTEILTPHGWRGIGQFESGDSVYGFNKETGRIETVHVIEYGERAVRDDENMVELQSQRFNIRVTEGHQFHIKYRDPGKAGARSDSWLVKTGREMSERKSAWSIPSSAEADFPGVPLSDDELRLIAWFMTDGSIYRQTLEICQSKIFKHEIRAIIERIGLSFRERVSDSSNYPNGKPATRFEIPKGSHTKSLARNGWGKYEAYLDKNVSPLLLQMSREQFRVFWDELIKGDGAKQQGKNGWLWCDRKEQADAYTHLAVTRGFSASYSEQKTKNGKTMYVISCRDSQWIGTDPSAPLAASFRLVKPIKGERVWCIKNSLSTIITRRGGKIAVIGNCADVMIGISARPFTKSLSSHIQQMGRVMRPCYGKDFALWLDHSGNYLRFKDDWEEIYGSGVESLDDGREKPKKEPTKKEKEQAKCPKCSHVWPAKSDICSHCGHVRLRKNEVLEKPGNLIELGYSLQNDADMKRSFYQQLYHIEINRNYKKNWARNAFKDKFGSFPMFNDFPVEPTETTLRWVKSRLIRFAKRRHD